MASPLSLLLLSAFSILLFTSFAVARPFKTLLISTYTVSEVRPDLFAVVAEFREFHPRPLEFNPGFFHDDLRFQNPGALFRSDNDRQTLMPRPQIPRGRTIDVASVLASLLFGAACGALTAATMYLVWSLFNWRLEAYRSLDDFSDDDDDIFSPKKVHNKESGNAAVPADSVETALLKKESV